MAVGAGVSPPTLQSLADATAQARRLYHHVHHGGQVKDHDLAYIVEQLERLHLELRLSGFVSAGRLRFSAPAPPPPNPDPVME